MSARTYAREIEAAWTALLERPVVLGERDWALICDWHARGIPLALVRDAMQALGEKLRRRRRSPRNLGALVSMVEEAWQTVREGRLSEEGIHAEGPAALEDPRQRWRRCAEARAVGDPLRVWIEELLERLETEGVPPACDSALAEGLLERLSAAEREALAVGVDAELAGFRDRMKPATWSATRERALVSAARRKLDLPRLTDARRFADKAEGAP